MVVEVARTMLIQGKVAHTFWREAVSTVVYTMNQVLIKNGKDMTPFEYWTGKTPVRIVESINVRVDENSEKPKESGREHVGDERVVTFLELVANKPSTSNCAPTPVDADADEDEDEEEKQEESVKNIPRYAKLNHDPKQIIGDKDARILIRRKVRESSCMIFEFEPKSFKEAHKYED
ncbi:hypothetical protein SUGI_0883460 [Cryptomeria japonica]|nr:hypothetical protein SUGI_0883460 [Cryptomeria japonica]